MSRKRKQKRRHSIPVQPLKSETAKRKEQSNNPTTLSLTPLITCLALVLIGGVVNGIQTNRWTVNSDITEAAARLEHVPTTFGDWEGQDLHMDEEQLKRAGAAGHVQRTYRNRVTGDQVILTLLCGQRGPLALHPPTVCFIGAGWNLEQQPKRHTLTDGDETPLGDFQVTIFRRESTTSSVRMRTCWAWNATGNWQAPDSPRFAFAKSAHLYKIYVSSQLPARDASSSEPLFTDSPSSRFLRAFLPVLKNLNI